MKALVFRGTGGIAWQDVPDPGVEDATDAIGRVDAVTIRGTDLHIVEGDVPEVEPGRFLGHEAMGTVVETGGGVRPGDTVVVSGAGPAGLAAIVTARLCSPGRIVAVDLAEPRLGAARGLGADAAVEAVGSAGAG
ncbi:alcohol dehydrogenase catalytic domain-containing protein [Streptomyces sp. NPDC001732]